MTIEEMIGKSLEPVRDNADGTYSIKIPMGKYKSGSERKSWSKCIIKHCSECDEVWAVFASSDINYKIAQCSSECRLANIHKSLEPIEYDGKLYMLDDCSNYEIKTYRNPIKAHVDKIEYVKTYNQKEEIKVSNRKKAKKHRNTSPKYNSEKEKIKRNIRSSNYYNSNSEQILAQDKIKRDNRTPEEKRVVADRKNAWEKEDRKKYPEYYRIKNGVNQVLINTKAGKVKPINKYGIHIKVINEHLQSEAILLGYSSTQEIAGKGYDIDHIIPKSYYDRDSEEDLKRMWNIRNLRWLPLDINRSEGNKIKFARLELIKTLPKEIFPEGKDLSYFKSICLKETNPL